MSNTAEELNIVPRFTPGATIPFTTREIHETTLVTPYSQYLPNTHVSPFYSVFSTPVGSMAHDVVLANLRTQLQFSDISAPQTTSHNDTTNTTHLLVNTQTYPPPLDYNRPYKPPELLTKSKFIAPVALAEFHRKLKMPTNVRKYDGLSDTEDHYNVFVSAGGVEQWTMPAWCHMFVQTLVAAARICKTDP
ncbi:hypothetical protein R6Q57_024481 [Mikania cordata]